METQSIKHEAYSRLINSEIAAGIAVINTGKLFMQHGLKMTK
jgi:hypothetical protein